MSALKIDTAEVALPKLIQERSNFAFPLGRHILVATPRHIFAWDASGIHSVFQSSRNGIVAAKEATDGSGILAVASKDVVVLHDTKRGKEHSWGLNAPEEEIRHLQYSNDSKSLYLSTASDGLIQQYSLEKSRLLEPVQKHASAPVVLALSYTGHLMLSASSTPPAVYLKNLTHNTAASLMQPNVSTSPVCAVAFHPERSDIFMLAFCDATVAAYDATRVTKASHHASQATSGGGEISHIKNLHRRTAAGDLSLGSPNTAPPVVGIAFLPGHKLRAVTAGRDGRCRIVDFANGGTVLRTWHCKAPCTSISVITAGSAPRILNAPSATQRNNSSSLPAGGLIAVGLVDGRVQLYDTIGLLLAEERFSSIEERITSVDWVNGPSPSTRSTDLERGRGNFDSQSIENSGLMIPTLSSATLNSSNAHSKPKSKSKSGLGLPASLKPLSTQSVQPPRQLAIHPDEVMASTVRRSPASRQSHTAVLPSHRFEDLFSPVKPPAPRFASQRQVPSPHTNRPRLSSQTFTRSPTTITKRNRQRLALSLPSSASRTSKSSSATGERSPKLQKSPQTIQQAGNRVSTLQPKDRHISFKPSALNLGDATAGSSQRTASSRFNVTASRHLAKVIAARSTDQLKTVHPVLREQRLDERDEDADIWLTSEDEGRAHQRQTRRQKKANNLTSMLYSHQSSVPRSAHAAPHIHTDGSTEEEILTAHSILSPTNDLTAVSNDVRDLFPRSSSLSPHKGKREKEKKNLRQQAHASPPPRRDNRNPPLASLEVNAANGRQPKSPWARARARKDPTTTMMKAVRKNEFVTVLQNSGDGSVEEYAPPVESPGVTCLTCPETKARVQTLEGEVAQLKGEVLALKAVLRRHGVDVKGLLR